MSLENQPPQIPEEQPQKPQEQKPIVPTPEESAASQPQEPIPVEQTPPASALESKALMADAEGALHDAHIRRTKIFREKVESFKGDLQKRLRHVVAAIDTVQGVLRNGHFQPVKFDESIKDLFMNIEQVDWPHAPKSINFKRINMGLESLLKSLNREFMPHSQQDRACLEGHDYRVLEESLEPLWQSIFSLKKQVESIDPKDIPESLSERPSFDANITKIRTVLGQKIEAVKKLRLRKSLE